MIEAKYMVSSRVGMHNLYVRQIAIPSVSFILFATTLLLLQVDAVLGQQIRSDQANLVPIPTTIPYNMASTSQSSAERDSVMRPASNSTDYFEAAQASTCQKSVISSTSASGNDGNVPSNVVDNNLNTRWSNNGVGSWIQLDLGSKKAICSVDIAWYRGDSRENNFAISVSDDGNSFTNKFSDVSSGTTTSAERYPLPAGTEARYIRITVNGNTENNWASISEVAVFGSAGGSGGGTGDSVGSLYHKWQTTPGGIGWSSYQSLGGGFRGNIEVAANTNGRLEVFVTGTDDKLYHKWQTSAGSNTWTAWQSLSGGIKADTSPAVARNSDGRLEVFVVGANNQLYHKWQTSAGSNTWTAWQSLSGGIKADTSPAVARNSDGRLEVFVVGANNHLYHKWQTASGSSSSWSGWISLDGTSRAGTDPAVISNANGRLEAFVVGTGNALYHKLQTTPGSNTWTDWSSLGGGTALGSSPAVGINNDGRLDLFVLDLNRQLFHKSQTSSGSGIWTQWMPLGGGAAPGTSPTVGINIDGRLEVFVIGATNQLYHKSQTSVGSSTWSTWESLAGSIKENSSPAVAINSDGRLDAFVKGRSSGGGNGGGGGGGTGTNDKFGIKKIYPTKSGGEEWYMNMQDPSNDPRTSEPSMTKNSDGSWRVTSGQVRYGVFTSSGYHPDEIEIDHGVLASRGYMQSPNDWKNIEMTGQVKYNSGGDDEWTWYARGGRHTGSGYPEGCEGVALKGSLAYTGGQVRWAKEQWHVSYVFQPWKNSPADGDGKFVGFKVAIYNMQLNGETVVKMESWVDPNNNNQWQKVYDFIDQGGWGSDGGECGGAPDQIVTWGGPIASFRWDDGNSIDIKNLSVREIVPPNQ